MISPFSEIAVNNTPPVIKFEENGTAQQGPIATLTNAAVRTASLSEPLALTIWVTDDMKYTSEHERTDDNRTSSRHAGVVEIPGARSCDV